MASINEFLANISIHGDLAKSERFSVQFTLPPLLLTNPAAVFVRSLIFQCEAGNIPGLSLEMQKYRFYGPERKLAMGKIFEEIPLSIICTNDFYEKPLFDAWIDIANPQGNGWDLNYKNMYTGTITICQYDQMNNIVYAVDLINSWPFHVAAMQTRWSDDSYHRLNIEFAYDRYTPTTRWTNSGFVLNSPPNPSPSTQNIPGGI